MGYRILHDYSLSSGPDNNGYSYNYDTGFHRIKNNTKSQGSRRFER